MKLVFYEARPLRIQDMDGIIPQPKIGRTEPSGAAPLGEEPSTCGQRSGRRLDRIRGVRHRGGRSGTQPARGGASW
ncbi:protein of unknown function [Streptomyces sp. KY75]|nr:protein of unknown function [Streptomyces sp. KY70]CAD5995262.1 protein of unknown function [Streptomyces sp. KY75]